MQLAKALLNPTRIRILDAVAEGSASSDQIAATLGESPGVVSYHLSVLCATGCLQPVEVAPEGGGRAYEFAALAAPTGHFARSQAAPSPPGHPSAAMLRTMVDEGIDGLDAATFGGLGKDRLSCVSIVLDKSGWQEVSAAIDDAMSRVSIAHEESVKRLADTDGEGIDATIAVASFGGPPDTAPTG